MSYLAAVAHRILVIEDDETIAHAVAERLRSEAFVVDVASDGLEGVAQAERVPPDLVVLDLMLPGLDGLEVCRRIQRCGHVPVLMLTARDDEADVIVGLAVGADDYLTKPFSPRELVARVRAILRRVEAPVAPSTTRLDLGGRRSTPHRDRVRPSRRARHPTRGRPNPRATAHRGVGVPRWFGSAHGRLTHTRVAPEVGRRIDSHRARHRLRHRGPDVRPLDRIGSIKTKLSIVIVAAVAVTATTSTVGFHLGVPLWLRPIIAGTLALTMVQFLAHGMTRPLRDMANATTSMARGDYSLRVHTTAVDEVGRLAEAFNRMAAELAEIDRQRRDLVANVSHELRTPISALQATLENLVDGVAAPDPATLRAMHAQTERLGRLVRDLLDLSRLESGATQLRIERVSLQDLLARATEETRLHHPGFGVTLDLVPATIDIDGDHERLHQAIVNLLDNAVRYGGGHARVEIRGRRRDRYVRLDVCDDGPGIPLDEQSRVFERFYRADHAPVTHRGGAGLGLAIVRWIVELHGGTIQAEANKPHGCRMILDLPQRQGTIA
jgi:signal transduction histidine kinase/DNA-binding NarL/FixJ family response regulator